MLRKIMISMAAIAALGVAAAAPTAASAKGVHIGIGFGGYGYGPYYGGPYGYHPVYDYGPDFCTFKKVKVWSPKYGKFVWKTKHICY